MKTNKHMYVKNVAGSGKAPLMHGQPGKVRVLNVEHPKASLHKPEI